MQKQRTGTQLPLAHFEKASKASKPSEGQEEKRKKRQEGAHEVQNNKQEERVGTEDTVRRVQRKKRLFRDIESLPKKNNQMHQLP